MKDFENYTKTQELGNNSAQWEKRYEDGEIARAVVDNNKLTRALVREAFEAQEAQEAGVNIGCFQQSDSGRWCQ